MDETSKQISQQVITLKDLNQNSLDHTRAEISANDAKIVEDVEKLVDRWQANQQSKRLYNAVNSVLNPTQTPVVVVDDFNALIDLLIKTSKKILGSDLPQIQHERSFDFSGLNLKHALFMLLKYRQQPPNFDEIIDDLDKFNFGPKTEHHRERVRATLKYQKDNKHFFKIDENGQWSLTQKGENYFVNEISQTAESSESSQATISVNNHKVPSKTATNRYKTGERLIDLYVGILTESKEKEMHAKEIARLFTEKFSKKAVPQKVGSALRKNSRTKNPLVKALDGNVFRLVQELKIPLKLT